MELGTNFAAKLEPFLLISKSAKGAAAAKLIQDATSAQGVFVFAELLELPNIQEVCHVVWYLWPLLLICIPRTSWQTTSSMLLSSPCYRYSRIGRTRITLVCGLSPHTIIRADCHTANKDSLPQLNQAQIIKLKHLSIVSLAANRRVRPGML